MTTLWNRQLNPITRKRLARFRRRRRAYWSAWLLGLVVVLSLCADVICNDRPLIVRCNGHTYFPLSRYYPESTFIAGGGATRPDYKAIRERAGFRKTPGNFMLFAPVPFGPRETVDEESLRGLGEIEVALAPEPRVASINVDRDLVITRARAAQFFFARPDSDVAGLRLDAHWSTSEAMRTAIAARFSEQECPRLEEVVRSRQAPEQRVEMSLSTFSPRDSAPRTVRITLREIAGEGSTQTALFDRSGAPRGTLPPIWDELTEHDRQELLRRIKDCRDRAIDPFPLEIGGTQHRVLIQSNIRWPYPPVRGHWMGVDDAGRDVFARVLHGLRISLLFGFLLVTMSMTIGVIIGAIQGYFGGWVDISAQRFVEIWSALPFLYVMILIGSVYGQKFGLLLLCYAIFHWIGISYYMRAEFLRLRRQPFVESARVIGVSRAAIIFRHILPNALTPVITFIPFSLVGAISSLAALDYLGFGLPALTPSLGELLQQAQKAPWAWWLVAYPTITLFIVMLLTAFVGEGIREAFDPRQHARME